jgi:4-amino-4-deoxy-L-arabinose transferase-like glycosyltransferase
MPLTDPRHDARWLRLLFVTAALLRLYFVLFLHPPRAFVFSDMQSYDYVALEILSGRSNVWHAFRPVGYSLLLALVYALTDVSRTFVGVLQALMGAALVPWSAQLARAAGASRASALLAALVVLTNVPLILYSGLLLTEVPSAFFLLLGLKQLLVEPRKPRSPFARLAASGLYLGLAAAVRPNFLLALPVVALYALHWISRGGLPRARSWLLLGAGLALPLALVSLYNSHALGRPVGLSCNGGLNFYLNFADVHTIQYQGPMGQYWISPVPNGFDHTRQELTDVPLFEDAHYYARGLAFVREHPASLRDALQNFPEAAGVGRQLLWPGWPGHESLLASYSLGFFALVLLPALTMLGVLARAAFRAFRPLWRARGRAGLARAAVDGGASPPASVRPEALTLAALCASSALPIYLFLGDPRVRVPFDPLWIVLAALALDALARAVRGRFRRRRSP